MEDKSFELLTKIYSDLTEFKKDMTEFRKETKEDIKNLKNDVIRLENTTDANFKALFDGYKQTYEKLTVVEQDVRNLSAKVEKQEVEIKVIKGGRAKKASSNISKSII